ncbi:hypothetical protein ruthe_00909 [Rubellimicrobium thermophilum DSM 16684]|uniref:DUF1153 domain-containing protein n=1 Tax=Rubellimicrobium thermophilum DSM 16684 TaxID=1123069 RepID=S9QXP2_9RHOB|nr:DUF1153 domain-containing protein [Rubellimicrobium thermophilum]EPX86101.1 hypothetical protein ruthe_00909 [Rubellimicrobium thermophilum DSM 16684]
MYLRKVEGPRAVALPDGTTMTRADLPPPDTRRWVASRKAAVVKAVACGLISRSFALETYALSEEELSEWERAVERHGVGGLRTTWLQRYRQLEVENGSSS